MQLDTIIDDSLIIEARKRTGLKSEREILETVLRAWLALQGQEQQQQARLLVHESGSFRTPLME
ncbi:MAG: type II toxin-antitoxin system VapB family antitoxin [Gammaproteobacteria bacterium]|nr:type II toxin-antitoxin system VapB family antitoxin [Gammaproteobacteria bacterium]